MNFKEKVVLITGVGSGIGAATALYFAELGASLVLVEKNAVTLMETAEKCNSVASVPTLPLKSDVTKDAQHIVDETIKHFGQLDVLINNAGKGAIVTLANTTLAQYDDVMDLNVRSVYQLTKLALPHLLKTKGNIVNLCSVAGIRTFAEYLPYCLTKSAIYQFTRCLALDLATKGVRVNAVNPAAILSNFYKGLGVNEEQYDQYLENCKEMHPLGRIGNATEVAAAIAFLASDSARFITGANLPIDGGRAIMCARR